MAVADRMLRVVYRIESAWDVLAAVAMFAIMLILAGDALGRYVLNSPLPWAHNVMSRLLLPAAFFFALSFTLRANLHVNIDVVYRSSPVACRTPQRQSIAFLRLGCSLSSGPWAHARLTSRISRAKR